MLSSSKFDFLIKQNKNRIFSYALYMMHNRMDAEDITQEVLIRTWQNINKFKFSSARAWMMRTTHNLCIDYLRKNKAVYNKELLLNDESSEMMRDQNETSKPDELTANKLIDEKIKAAIRKLPERLKSPFVLYEIEGFKYKEISKILDVPLNTIKVNLLRARKQLQEELKELR